ncbi:MAG: leucine-rich repeat domain-containing protein, partial [Spirochaetota bacterium]
MKKQIVLIMVILLLIVLGYCNDTKQNTEYNLYTNKENKKEKQGEIVKFTDSNLESAIRWEINKLKGYIYKSDLKDITSIYATYSNIENLSGIEYCTNLTVLNLNGNKISDISLLAELKNLKVLDIGHNKISDISPLSQLTELKELWITNNN